MDGFGGLMAFFAIGFGVPLSIGLTVAMAASTRARRWPVAVLGILLWTALVGLAFHARETDGYYGDGTTRWEHAARFTGTWPVAGALITGGLVLAVLVAGTARPGGWARAGIPLSIGAFLWLAVAWFALTGGH